MLKLTVLEQLNLYTVPQGIYFLAPRFLSNVAEYVLRCQRLGIAVHKEGEVKLCKKPLSTLAFYPHLPKYQAICLNATFLYLSFLNPSLLRELSL